MEDLKIDYSESKGIRTINVVIFSYIALFVLYICVTEGIANRFGAFFICALVAFVLAAIMILRNTLWLPAPVVLISNERVESNPQGKKSIVVDWVSVSKVTIGMSYFVFLVNGEQKQKKIELSDLRYEDLKTVKSKIIELCEHKNIPYQND